MGLEPTTSELEVQRAIRCATAAMMLRKTQILSNPNRFFVRENNFPQTLRSNCHFCNRRKVSELTGQEDDFPWVRFKVCVIHESYFFAKNVDKIFVPKLSNCRSKAAEK